jgi:SAM-dependent methyltransferase
MCNLTDVTFVVKNLAREDIRGRRVLEVGSLNVNGSVRSIIESYGPGEYVGVDIVKGPGVDKICYVENLLDQFGENKFDVVICTELLEHVRYWRKAVSNIKGVCEFNGTILLSTRSYGFPYHGHPYDFWRYEMDDVRNIFSDCDILASESDLLAPGVLVKLRKPIGFIENDLSNYALYSIVVGKRAKEISDHDLENCHFKSIILRTKVMTFLEKILQRLLWSY